MKGVGYGSEGNERGRLSEWGESGRGKEMTSVEREGKVEGRHIGRGPEMALCRKGGRMFTTS